MTATIGFIGLGNMGLHMARNLLKHGHKLIAYDIVPKNLDALKLNILFSADGAMKASSPAEVADKSLKIFTMLPSNPHVEEVYTFENGLLSKIKPGTLCIDSSTIDPAVSRSIAELAKNKGATYLDAPVSGGVTAAENASLTFMVGGDESAFEQIESLLKQMGKSTWYCGAAGNGQAAKICNNMLLGISMLGVCETMNLGQRLGLDANLLARIINSSSGRCWSSDTYNPVPGVIEGVPASKNYQGGFGTALMAKDLGLAQAASTATLSPTPLGSLAHQIYRIMCTSGYASKDFSVAYHFLKEGSSP